MTSAMRQLNGIQTPHLDKLADAVEQVQDRLEPMQDMVHNAAVFASVTPAMLDSDGGAPRTYLILSQTNSELRPGGGLPGSWGHDDHRQRHRVDSGVRPATGGIRHTGRYADRRGARLVHR